MDGFVRMKLVVDYVFVFVFFLVAVVTVTKYCEKRDSVAGLDVPLAEMVDSIFYHLQGVRDAYKFLITTDGKVKL